MRAGLFFLLFFFLLLPLPANAELYSWVDGSGDQFFSDDPERIPERYRSQARKLDSSKGLISYESRSGDSSPRSGSGSDAVLKDHNGHDERWWRNQVKSLRDQIKREEDSIAYYDERRRTCEEEEKAKLGYRKNCAAMFEEGRKRAEWNIEKVKRKIEAELPEEARRAGAMPGWVRE